MKKKQEAWVTDQAQKLASADALRALALAQVQAFGIVFSGSPVSEEAARDALRSWEAAGWVKKARRGLWLNALSRPAGSVEDLLSLARPGAVASLHSVLGSCGAHNNPSVMAFGVRPAAAGVARDAGRVSTLFGDLCFYELPERFFGEEWMSSASAQPSFAPEKALLDWIYLGAHPKTKLPEPNPADIDLEALDLGLAAAWAQKLRLRAELSDWLGRHPEPTEKSLELVRLAREEGLSVVRHPKLAAGEGHSQRERARARGLAR